MTKPHKPRPPIAGGNGRAQWERDLLAGAHERALSDEELDRLDSTGIVLRDEVKHWYVRVARFTMDRPPEGMYPFDTSGPVVCVTHFLFEDAFNGQAALVQRAFLALGPVALSSPTFGEGSLVRMRLMRQRVWPHGTISLDPHQADYGILWYPTLTACLADMVVP